MEEYTNDPSRVPGIRVQWYDSNPVTSSSGNVKTRSVTTGIWAIVNFENYTGSALNTSGGITSIRTGSLILSFEGTSNESTGNSIVSLDTLSIEAAKNLEFVKSDDSGATVYSSEISCSASNIDITIEYSSEPGDLSLTIESMSINQISISSDVNVSISGTKTEKNLPWNENADTSWYDPSSTDFTISTATELAGMAKLVNDGITEFEGTTIKLTANIDLMNLEWDPIGGPFEGPDGSAVYEGDDSNYKGFRGTFDGDNHTISNLKITKPITNTDNSFAFTSSDLALFGVLENGSEVKKLTLSNVNIEGDAYLGAIAGVIPTASEGNAIINLSDITITGNINVKGKFSIGGIIGRIDNGNTTTNLKSVSINGNAGSFIGHAEEEAPDYFNFTYAGGMVGASYSAGSTTFTSCAVSGINVLGLYIGAGGYIGLGNGTTTFDNCSITNSSLEMLNKFDDNGGQARTGAFVGCVTGPNVTVNFQNSTNVESITIIYPFAENSGIKPVYSGLIGSLQNYDDIDFTVNGTIPGTVDGISFRYTS